MSRKFRDPIGPRRTAADAVEAAVAASEKGDRVVSLSRAAVLLGRDRETLTRWKAKGLPVERAGATGEAVLVDLKKVVEWLEERARTEERKKWARPDDDPSESGLSPSDLVKLEDLKIKRQKLAMTAKILVHRDPLEMTIRQANGLGRQTVMSVPDLVARLLVGSVPREKSLEVRREVWNTCAAAMKSWQTEVASGMRAAADRIVAMDDEDEDEDDGEA